MAGHPGRTALYRFYDAEDNLLYLGISYDPDGRWEAHKYWSKTWERLAVRRALEWFDTRTEALTAETAAIRAERPKFNTMHNFELAPVTCFEWPSLTEIKRGKAARLAELICAEIDSGRWKSGQRVPDREAMAEATGVCLGTAVAATAALTRQGVLVRRMGAGLFVARG